MTAISQELIDGLRSLAHPYAQQAANLLEKLDAAAHADLAAAVGAVTTKAEAVAGLGTSAQLPPAVIELQQAVADVIKQFTKSSS